MAKKDYAALADAIIEKVGGKANISYLTHCVTRLRFNLKDRALANLDEIKKVPGVLGVQWSGDQLQVIIGQSVDQAYKTICDKYGIEKQAIINENLDEDLKKKKFGIGTIFEALAACIIPAIPATMACGLIRVLANLLTNFGLMAAESETIQVLNLVGNLALYFLPILVAYGAAKRFGMNIAVAMTIGAIFVSPVLIGMAGEGITVIHFFGIPLSVANYSSTVLPVVLTIFVGSYVEKFLKRIIPSCVSFIGTPLLTVLVLTPLALGIFGPFGSWVGILFANAFSALYAKAGFLAIAILSALTLYLIMTGMHMALTPVCLQFVSTLGYDPSTMVTTFIASFGLAAACLAVGLKAKNKDLKELAFSNIVTVLVGGITEPALYGIALKYKKPMYAITIGSFVGGWIAGWFHVGSYALSAINVFTLVNFIGPTPANFIWAMVAIGVTCVISFVLTLIFGFEEEANA